MPIGVQQPRRTTPRCAIRAALETGAFYQARLARSNKLVVEERLKQPLWQSASLKTNHSTKRSEQSRNRTECTTMIREYETRDTDALISIWEKANAMAHPFLPKAFLAQVKEDMRNVYLPIAETWVLEDNGQPIGFIAMIGNEIGGLFLDPVQHGKGSGRAMVDHIVAIKGPLRVEVFKDNTVGRPFYERYGFVLEEEYLHEQSGHVTIKMAMPGAE